MAGRPRTHCINGHSLDDAYVYVKGNRRRRECRSCRIGFKREPGAISKIPSAPLVEFLRAAVRRAEMQDSTKSGLKRLSRMYAARYGNDPKTVERQLHRMTHTPRERVTVFIADRWLTVLGSHLIFLYPDLYLGEKAA